MRDKSLSIWLIVLFGIPGMAIILLAWLWTALETQRIAATIVGSVGLLTAIVQLLLLKHSPGRTDNEPVLFKVGAEDKA